jgi:hypothetical protein
MHFTPAGAIIRARFRIGRPTAMSDHNETQHGDPAPPPAPADERKLRPEDQARVDGFLKRGVNSVERKPFRPILLMIMLIVVVTALSLFSQWLADRAGVY